jgi:hypothetical protein
MFLDPNFMESIYRRQFIFHSYQQKKDDDISVYGDKDRLKLESNIQELTRVELEILLADRSRFGY